jgi:hypothetical protein
MTKLNWLWNIFWSSSLTHCWHASWTMVSLLKIFSKSLLWNSISQIWCCLFLFWQLVLTIVSRNSRFLFSCARNLFLAYLLGTIFLVLHHSIHKIIFLITLYFLRGLIHQYILIKRNGLRFEDNLFLTWLSLTVKFTMISH